ncbi:MAG: hypothetical protein A2754_01260 [Candidatus Magasanikbacteria bacterium RIFCSPHIGHO2_01_FULL_47_8]|uniref:Uncharacterized protein n=1 Tax=Candidatus Magasanikbacteria bacterium RIFCSPHIGHO2_01_FULL_47_8 TaxID=1798673 RepID=A0A1F6MCA3_9BACT|nr:MAG: hypothetical protein A2754_01260 [Candidatus Magasanikbacteria bacterium RIFCSPHIGHO2_01_FULL_47_8]
MISNEELMAKLEAAKSRPNYSELLDIAIKSHSPTSAAKEAACLTNGQTNIEYQRDIQHARWIAMAMKRNLVTARSLIEESSSKLNKRKCDDALAQNEEKYEGEEMTDGTVMTGKKSSGDLTVYDIRNRLNTLMFGLRASLIRENENLEKTGTGEEKVAEIEKTLSFVVSFEIFASKVLREIPDVSMRSSDAPGGFFIIKWRNITTKEEVFMTVSLMERYCNIVRRLEEDFHKSFLLKDCDRIFFTARYLNGNVEFANIEGSSSGRRFIYTLEFHGSREELAVNIQKIQ